MKRQLADQTSLAGRKKMLNWLCVRVIELSPCSKIEFVSHCTRARSLPRSLPLALFRSLSSALSLPLSLFRSLSSALSLPLSLFRSLSSALSLPLSSALSLPLSPLIPLLFSLYRVQPKGLECA